MSREFASPEDGFQWTAVKNLPAGAREAIIYRDEALGTYSRFLKLEPGFQGTDKQLVHDFDEIVYIISGGVIDRTTGKAYEAGSVAVFPEGQLHGPLAAPVGAYFLEFRHYRSKVHK